MGLGIGCITNFPVDSTKATGLYGNEFGCFVIMLELARVDNQVFEKMNYIKLLYFIMVFLFKSSL